MASNNPEIPYVLGATLYAHDASEICLVNSPAWYDWLEENKSFAYSAASGDHLTAVKERRTSSSGKEHYYWYAYRSVAGEKRRLTLGKSELLDLGRLQRAAEELAKVSGGGLVGKVLRAWFILCWASSFFVSLY